MDAVLLDTDVFSYLIRKNDTRAEFYRPHVKGKTICLSFITVGELYYWVAKRNWSAKSVQQLEERIRAAVVIPYDHELCRKYGRIRTSISAGRVIASNDLWIAACAIRHALPLLTNNKKHFYGIPGLRIITKEASTEDPLREAKPQNLFDDPGETT